MSLSKFSLMCPFSCALGLHYVAQNKDHQSLYSHWSERSQWRTASSE